MVRELFINAFAHADYSRAGETIKVFVYDDRIEIINPGPMLPGLTTDDIREAAQRSATVASRRAATHPLHGALRHRLGEDRARDGPGYPEPGFDGDGPLFSATIWPHPSFAGSRLPPSRQRGG